MFQISTGTAISPQTFALLCSLKEPLVLIGNKMLDLTYVGIDDKEAMRELTLNLAEIVRDGDILYFAPVLSENLNSTNAQRLRLEGFVDAVNSLGKSCRVVTDVEEIRDFGAIVCSTDYYALKALKHLGYPDNIIISGFDNVSMLKNLKTRVLTVDYSTDKIAEECLNYILGRRFEQKIEHRILYNV